ncbi:hypothetical protein HD806DRAFT_503529 [Xylariaceae sp. AK1471]|nr:hypothetical protein HD806DRAFT_503529 [Xylariaceae sp. AK1471]
MGDPFHNKSFELDRSTSPRASLRQSRILSEDDDYDLQAMGISDGFRPVEVAQNHNSSHVARPSVSSLEPPVARAVSPRPSSISKPHSTHESFSLRHDGLERTTARHSSVSTNSTFMPTETPYNGPSGPSYPYQMYPQDVRLARTASLATTLTAPVSERSYNGPHRPTHPYGIYPQIVASGDDGSGDRLPQRDINVGFPGTADRYQRRLGPDGEEAADMIGPDGHTEQLPPYTRYPDEAYVQKALGVNVAQSAPPSPPVQQNLDIPGAGGIGLATRNPEFASTEDLGQLHSPLSRRSIRSFTSEASRHSINTAALAVTNEKSTPNWKAAARRKVWGVVPCWAVVLAVIVLVLLGVVVGIVIGTVIVPHLKKGPPHDKPPYPPTTPGPGFEPYLTVPPGLPPLVEGPFSLTLFSFSNTRSRNVCLKDPAQGRAWNCEAIMSQLVMNISRKQDSEPVAAYALDLSYNHAYTPESNTYTYGVQPPSLTGETLRLVNDTWEPSRGPAWALSLPYTKTIILPDQYLTQNDTSLDKVQRRMMFGYDFKRKGLAQLGDKPWVCTWPGTILEVFIYVTQNSSPKYPMLSGSTTNAPTPSLPSTESSTGAQQTGVHHRDAIKPHHNDDYSYGNEKHPYPDSPTPSPTTPSPTSPASATSSQTPSGGSDNPSHPPMQPPLYPAYPRVMKVEERRIPQHDAPIPTCRQVQIMDNGEAKPVTDDSGQPVEIQILEDMQEYEEKYPRPYVFRRHSFEQQLRRRDDPHSNGDELSECGCIWLIT